MRSLLFLVVAVVTPVWASAQPTGEWTPPRTPDGQPDIQGVWTNFDRTPFETPDDVDLERLAPLAHAGYRILQARGLVIILYEMIHEARIIPVDGRPHAPDRVRQWNGDSRGRWEGTTLVVEVTNYNDKGTIATNIATQGARGLPGSEDLRVVERFTVVDADTISYEVTIEDPHVYTAPWTVAMPLNRDETYELYEYGCHEGNYGLLYSLSAGRAEDRAAASGGAR